MPPAACGHRPGLYMGAAPCSSLILLLWLRISSLRIVALAGMGCGRVAVTVFMAPGHWLHQSCVVVLSCLLLRLRCFRSAFGARIAVGVSLRRPSVLFRMLSRITGVRRRGRAGPVQPRAGRAAVRGWPVLLRGHGCHWCLSGLYIYIYKTLLLPCAWLCRRVAGAVGWRLLARFRGGAACLGPSGALAVRAASCMFGGSPPPAAPAPPPPLARASILYKETRFSVVLFTSVGPH